MEASLVASTSPGVSIDRYREVRSLTEDLSAPLSPEDQTVQSMPDVSPTKWHRAHTSWFFEEFLLGPHDPGYRCFDDRFRYLFNSYYEAVGPRHPRPERGIVTRPGAEEVGAYRRHVDEAVERFLGRDQPVEVLGLAELGLHHEQQHQELLLMDIKHVLSCNPLDPVYRQQARGPAATGSIGWVEQPGGLVEVGHDGPGFAYDNESPRHPVHLQPFAIASRPVTNGEWMAFIDDGGYRRPALWLSEGWYAVQEHGWDAPLYWQRDADRWTAFTLGGRHPVDPGEPVCHVSYYEADAFARWAGFRLPTEAEWETVAATQPVSGRFCEPEDLHPRAAGADQGTVRQLYGEVWEWTASPYIPYPGFSPAPGAVGEYNGKFMVNQQVLRGGACVTPPGHIRATYRNFFPASARWAFAGLRLARST